MNGGAEWMEQKNYYLCILDFHFWNNNALDPMKDHMPEVSDNPG